MNWIGARMSAPPSVDRPRLTDEDVNSWAVRVADAVKRTGQSVPTGGVWRFVLEEAMRWPDAERVFARCEAHGVRRRKVDRCDVLVAEGASS